MSSKKFRDALSPIEDLIKNRKYRGDDYCATCLGTGIKFVGNGAGPTCKICHGTGQTPTSRDGPPPNLRVPPITLSLKSVDTDGQTFGDQLIRLHVNGNKFALADELNKLARIIAATSDNEYDEGTVSIFILRRKKS